MQVAWDETDNFNKDERLYCPLEDKYVYETPYITSFDTNIKTEICDV
jgi:hypothetical protein